MPASTRRVAPQTVVVIGAHAESLLAFRGPLMQAMAAQGHRVVACASGGSPALRAALADLGIAYRDVPLRRTGLNPLHDLLSLCALVGLLRALRPDALLVYEAKAVVYGGLAARLTRVPAIFAMIEGVGYAFTSTELRARIAGLAARWLFRAALRGAVKVFFLNPDNRSLFERLGLSAPRQAVLLNGIGIDLEEFRPAPLPKRPCFLLIARLLRDKGIVEYAEAARILKAKYPEISFRLVGWIDDRPMAIREGELRAWVDEGVIEFLGRLDDVRPAIAGSSVYVLPSYHEGLPRTVMEAMAMGRPIVTTDAAGCRETVAQGENGWLVPIGDVPALAAAMEHFIRHPDQIATMGAASRRIAVARYDVHEVNDMIIEAMRLA